MYWPLIVIYSGFCLHTFYYRTTLRLSIPYMAFMALYSYIVILIWFVCQSMYILLYYRQTEKLNRTAIWFHYHPSIYPYATE